MWYKNFKKLKNIYKSDIKDFDSVDRGDTFRINEYKFVGFLRTAIIWIPFVYIYMKYKYLYKYYYSFNLVISTLVNSKGFAKVFNIYSIYCVNRYGYYIFESKHAIPEEFQQAHIDTKLSEELIVQHFQDTALKLFDDISEHEISDRLNLDSMGGNKLELFLEPDGYYEIIALKELNDFRKIVRLIYTLIILTSLFFVFL